MMDIEKLYEKYSMDSDNQIIEQAKRTLNTALMNHIHVQLPTLEYMGNDFSLYTQSFGKLHIESDNKFRFNGMNRKSHVAQYTVDKIHLLPTRILAHVDNELRKCIDSLDGEVNALHKAAASSILNYSLDKESRWELTCPVHISCCGEIVSRLRMVMVSLLNDIGVALDNISTLISVFDTAIFVKSFDVAKIKLNFYAHAIDKTGLGENYTKTYSRTRIHVESLSIQTLELSEPIVNEVKDLLQFRNYLYDINRFQPVLVEIGWMNKQQ